MKADKCWTQHILHDAYDIHISQELHDGNEGNTVARRKQHDYRAVFTQQSFPVKAS